jgi:hypothetical protein
MVGRISSPAKHSTKAGQGKVAGKWPEPRGLFSDRMSKLRGGRTNKRQKARRLRDSYDLFAAQHFATLSFKPLWRFCF